MVKYGNIYKYIKEGDEILNNIINNRHSDDNNIGNIEKCLMHYNTALELAELQKDHNLKNDILSKINLVFKTVINIKLDDIELHCSK